MNRVFVFVCAMGLFPALCQNQGTNTSAEGVSTGSKRVGFQGTDRIPTGQQAAVYVEPVMLTEVYDQIGPSLNIGAVVFDQLFARGLQKGADVWGFQLDLFASPDLATRRSTAMQLIDNAEAFIV